MFLNEPDKSTVLHVIKERLKRMDKSLKIKFWPTQVIIGNFALRFSPKSPLIFEQNGNRKICIRISLPADPLIGYASRDVGIALTQLNHVSVKDEDKDVPAVITCEMNISCAERLMKMLTGLQEHVEGPFRHNKALSRNITFTLDSWPESSPETFCKVFYEEPDGPNEFHFDFDVGKQLLLNEIHAVWKQCYKETWRRRVQTGINHTTPTLIDEIDAESWRTWLYRQRLHRGRCPGGIQQYMAITDNQIGSLINMSVNSEAYSQGKGVGMDRPDPTLVRDEKRNKTKGKKSATKDDKTNTAPELKRRNSQEFAPTFDANEWRRGNEERVAKRKRACEQKEVPATKAARTNHAPLVKNQQQQQQTPAPLKQQSPLQRQLLLQQQHHQQQQQVQRPTAVIDEVFLTDDELSPPTLPTPATPYMSTQTHAQYSPYPQPPPIYQQPYPPNMPQQSIGYGGGGGAGGYYSYQQMNGQVGELVDGMRQLGNPNVHMQEVYQQRTQYPHYVQPGPMPYGSTTPTNYVYNNARPDSTHTMSDNEFLNSCGLTVGEASSSTPCSSFATTTAAPAPATTYTPYPQLQNQKPQYAAFPPMREPRKIAVSAPKREINSKILGEEMARKPSDRVNIETKLFSFPKRSVENKDPASLEPMTLYIKDIKSLDRKEFVNDQVINFMISYISNNMIQDMSRIVMYNTYFYTGLMKNINTSAFNGRKPIDPHWQRVLMENLQRVIRWTKKFDPFARDYIVIPINEEYHWLLVVVFNPVGAIVDTTNETESRKKPKCYIAFLDPLSGLDPCKRNHMTYAIKNYLIELYKATKAHPKGRFPCTYPSVFDPDRVIVERVLNTPVQNNFYDCGPYTMYFIEGLFCYANTRITVHDFPSCDWREKFPECDAQADLMRDKVYNIMVNQTTNRTRSLLDRFEQLNRCGLNIEGAERRRRRHSAHTLGRMEAQHPRYRPRRYSLNPPASGVIDTATFQLPREMVKMPATQRARALRMPEENFAIIY